MATELALNLVPSSTKLPLCVFHGKLQRKLFARILRGKISENVITNLMTKQVGVDSEDLLINGDENVSKDNLDYDFLKLNTGIKKMIQDGGHVVDVSGTGGMDLEMFYKAVASIPNRFNNGNLRWLMSPTRAQQWELFLLKKITEKGGAVPQELYKSPVAIPSMQVPGLSNDAIILAEPKNLIEVNTYSMKLRKDATSKDAIMQDKRFYVIHFDFDALIEEIDATAIITGLPEYTFA